MEDNRQIIYGDESCFAVDMPRLHGDSQIGKRCYGLRNFGEKKRTNAVGDLCTSKLMRVSLFDCNVDTLVFKIWVEEDLLTKRIEKSVFVIDNASFHKDKPIKTVLVKHAHNLLYLSPYNTVESDRPKMVLGEDALKETSM